MEDLDRGDEARRPVTDVAEQQHVAAVGQESRGFLRDDDVVERLLEPSDLALIARTRTHDPDLAHVPQPTWRARIVSDAGGRRTVETPRSTHRTGAARLVPRCT
jgi:hypothetical protein